MSSFLDPPAQALADIAGRLNVGVPVTGHKWDPRSMSQLPVCVVALPNIRRRGLGEADMQIGTDDWLLTYPVYLFFDLTKPGATQQLAADTVEAYIRAIDADPTLGIPTVEATVTEATPHPVQDQRRPLLAYQITVELRELVPSNQP